ncbi:sensor histidine kinase [Metabacillus arenae]|uniref:histidine kinase n=1 Tax=Metabacillus arenae TaxID=2771434 RepID=A0A926RYM9_9BACI|nr:HAMP domain-containing sensor histidine kinase [Metabacillus arenae]MBD1382246.1 HAMP domain-containing histidine kinase [Metabacillus arenae]
MSYIAFILYLSKFNYYYNLVNPFFDISPGTWNNLVVLNLHPETIIRLLNGGVILFLFSFISFVISFTTSRKKTKKTIHWIIFFGTIFLLQFLYYDPAMNLFLQDYTFETGSITAYQTFSQIGDIFFQFYNACCLLIGLLLMVFYYFRYSHIRFMRNYTLFSLLSLLPLAIIHYLLFSWAPENLVKTTYSMQFRNYLQPDFKLYLVELQLFPFVTLLSLGFMIFNVYKYNSIESYHRDLNVLINRKIDTASLGIRAFTHSVKNHLLAIQSETEFLYDRFKDDEEALYSLSLIQSSCEQSFQSINHSAEMLKHITLNMKPSLLDVPVEKAIKGFQPLKKNIRIYLEKPQKSIKVYLDEKLIIEVIHNMIKNSIEAIGDRNGAIYLEIKQVDDWGVLSITDDGPGIETENLNEVFTPFYSTKSPVTNWGIGLSFCHKIITAHDGKVEINSQKGKGTQINIFFPLPFIE